MSPLQFFEAFAISFVNLVITLERAASVFPFLCFMFAHLEWPANERIVDRNIPQSVVAINYTIDCHLELVYGDLSDCVDRE